MILVTDTFEKLLAKMRSVSLDDVKTEIRKHQNGLDNFRAIGMIRDRKIIKGYLLSGKVRLVTLFQEKNGNYAPFYIVRKETKDGFNISKYSLEDMESKIERILDDVEQWKYTIHQ